MRLDLEINGKNGVFKAVHNDVTIGEISFILVKDNHMAFNHTEVYPEFGGRGLGKQMVLEAVNYARQHQLKIIPLCSFVSHVFEENDSLNDVLA